jgi:hypothetical protein
MERINSKDGEAEKREKEAMTSLSMAGGLSTEDRELQAIRYHTTRSTHHLILPRFMGK